MGAPEISVVVPSHDRPLRLRWLLNALQDQTLANNRWEVVVGHDSAGPETDELLEGHPLTREGSVRVVRQPPGSAPPGANRNAAWRAAGAPVIAFTDDDCRPSPDWLERALELARANPGAIVQGATVPDPVEAALLHAPHWHTQRISPPSRSAEACNIVYPREVLELTGGFDEGLYYVEDTELFVRASEAGAELVGAPDLLTYHAVVPLTLAGKLRDSWRWQDLPEVVRRHPRLRNEFTLWLFWKPVHVWLPLALLGALLGRRRSLLGLLALPYLMHALPYHGHDPRGRLRALLELPARVLVDLAEIAALARGSARHRTLFL
jgi:glycosyltransferase involved in cell wall biosynthesis